MLPGDPAVQIINILSILLQLISLGCFLFLLVNMFMKEGVLHGLVGLLCCQLYVLIWGWLNSASNVLFGAALLWTLSIALQILLVVGIAFASPDIATALWGFNADNFMDSIR